MRTKQVNIYSAAELQTAHPRGFENAFSKFRQSVYDDPAGAHEIRQSLKAIQGYFENAPELDGPTRAHDVRRCMAWIENHLLSALRLGPTPIKNRKARYYGQKPGEIRSCPFTGVCFDEGLLDYVKKGAREGRSPHEIKRGLSEEADRLWDREIEFQTTEEAFLDSSEMNDWEYHDDGSLA